MTPEQIAARLSEAGRTTEGEKTMTRCPDMRTEGFSGSEQVPCQGVIRADGSSENLCGEPCSFIMDNIPSPVARSAWRPMSSAPTDGTMILVAGGTYFDDGTFAGPTPLPGIALVSYQHTSCVEGWQGENSGGHDQWLWHDPVCWQPLSDPPTIEELLAFYTEK